MRAGSPEPLRRFLDARLGDRQPVAVEPMRGGGSCEVFAVTRGAERWVLRRAPQHANATSAHDVLREFRILDAIKDEPVLIARPVLACADPEVFGSPFYLMERIAGVPVRSRIPGAWAARPDTHGLALEQLVDALAAIHAVDWRGCGLEDLSRSGAEGERRTERWLAQLDGYGGRELPEARQVAAWLDADQPPDQPAALCHGDYKLDNLLFAPQAPPRLLAVVDWEMAAVGDPLVDLAWALIFHPGPEGTLRLGVTGEPGFAVDRLPDRAALVKRYTEASGRDTAALGWYEVFARWKLAVVLEGSYAKFLRGHSDKPVHEYFGRQADLLLRDAATLIDRGDPL
ncbi:MULTISPECIES: phosphotransferase family protein [Streptacidiphilus]|uniref:Phosphotransferase family protein n=2 Tax=Streptacidiphilus TaxID=228398 RepID=A0ABV6UL23_9ACTN|nr:phosphotransferase family protein [Streptacidiphilus jeojiense]